MHFSKSFAYILVFWGHNAVIFRISLPVITELKITDKGGGCPAVSNRAFV